MGTYSIGALVLVILMTFFIEFYIFKFESLRKRSVVKKQRR